jgi:hypothetical protein
VDRPAHFLITRFNVPIPQWARDKAGTLTLDDEWIRHRLDLFNRYCAPTVAGQSEKNFRWLIYCDENTPGVYREMIKSAVTRIPQAEIRYVNNFEGLKKDLKELMVTDASSFYITSRVDNDDGLGIDYIKLIQQHFVEADKTLVNLNGGILYDTEKKILTELPAMTNNHFGSLIEKKEISGHYITVMGFAHHDPPRELKIINVPCRYAWLKLIHTRNVKSRTNGVPLLSGNVSSHFALDKNVFQVSFINTLVYVLDRLANKMFRKPASENK